MSDRKAKEVEVELLKEHTHKKVVHLAGAKIMVRENTAKRLREQGVCK